MARACRPRARLPVPPKIRSLTSPRMACHLRYILPTRSRILYHPTFSSPTLFPRPAGCKITTPLKGRYSRRNTHRWALATDTGSRGRMVISTIGALTGSERERVEGERSYNTMYVVTSVLDPDKMPGLRPVHCPCQQRKRLYTISSRACHQVVIRVVQSSTSQWCTDRQRPQLF